jgi:hypothetical protein
MSDGQVYNAAGACQEVLGMEADGSAQKVNPTLAKLRAAAYVRRDTACRC